MARLLTDHLAYLDERLGSHSGRGPEYHFSCPACVTRLGDESKSRKLGINVSKRVGGCFRCGFAFRSFEQLFRYINGGTLRMEEFALLRGEVRLPTSIDLKTAVRRRLFHRTPVPPLKVHALPSEFVRLCDVPAASRLRMPYKIAFEYLTSRGATEFQLEEYQIGYCVTGEYARRLIFPVIQGGAVVYFTSRYCDSKVGVSIAMKAKNPVNTDGFHQRGTCLLNYDNCIGSPTIGLVEGAFSAFAFRRAANSPIPAIAMLGKFLSDEQRRLIGLLVTHGLTEVIIGLDPGAGKQSDKIRSALTSVVPVVSWLPLETGDPDDLKDSLPDLIEQRREPSVLDRVRQRLNG